MKTLSLLFTVALLVNMAAITNAQNVGINSDGTAPDGSAMLDVRSTSSGILIPRMTQAERNAIATPAEGLLIYQTNVTPGFYYRNGSNAWTLIGSGSGNGTVTSVATGTGLTGGPITATGTIALANTTVTAGSYTRATITVDAQGRITAAGHGDAVSLSSGVTGVLPLANGGTNATSAADARNNLGATTVGGNMYTLTNPSAITFLRVNSDNTVSALNAADFRTAIGAGSGGGTVTSVSGTSPISVATGSTTPAISISAATTLAAGSMSALDKTKLDGIDASANNYTHPTGDGNLHVPATSTTNSGKVLTAGATAGSLSWNALTSSQWKTTGSDIYYNTGNVGIGKATPTAQLDVLSSNTFGISSIGSTTGSTGLYHIANSNAPTSWNLGVEGGAWASGAALGSLYIDKNGVGPKMTIAPDGNVGIGTITPSVALDVNGSFKASGMPTIICPITTVAAGNNFPFGTAESKTGNISSDASSITIGETGLYLISFALGFTNSSHGWITVNGVGRLVSWSVTDPDIFTTTTVAPLNSGDVIRLFLYSGTFSTDANRKFICVTKLH